MTASPTTRRIAVAGRSLLDKEGSEALTMRRVARAVGITPMAIYRHYRDRADLLNAWADALTCLPPAFAPSTGAPSGDISMAFATDYRRTGSALLAVTSTAVLVWFGTG